MRFNTIIRFNNNTDKSEVLKTIVSISNENKIRNLKKGIRLMNGNVTMAVADGNDFVEDKFTTLIKFDTYKIPRIISGYILKKIKPSIVAH